MFSSDMPRLLAYHAVDPQFYWGITRVAPQQFGRQMRFLADNGYRTVSLCEVIDPSRTRAEREICITFDDGYETVFEYALPILQSFGFRATVFPISHYVGKWNAWDVVIGGRQLRHMDWRRLRLLVSRGWEIGSHTAHHRDLTSLSQTELTNELRQSKIEIEERVGAEVHAISYPFGQFNQRVMAAARSVGYKAGCGMIVAHNWKDAQYSPFNISRSAVYLIDTMKDFRSKLQQESRPGYQEIKQRLLGFGCKGTILVSG